MVDGRTRNPPSRREPQPVTWVAMLNRTLFLGAAVLVGGALLMTTTVLVRDDGSRPQAGVWILAGSQAALMATFVGFSRRRITFVGRVVTLVVASAGLLGAAFIEWPDWKPEEVETRQLLPALAMGIQLMSVALIVRSRRWVAVAMTTTVVAGIWLSYGVRGVKVEPEAWVVPVSFAVSAGVIIRALRSGAQEAARSTERRREVRANVIAHSSAEVADDEGRRLVHDRVIGALATVEAGRDSAVVAEECAGALRELALLDPTTSASSLRDALAERHHPQVHVGGSGWRMSPPPRVVTALRESAGEAISNVGRHAGVDEVFVVLSTASLGQAVVEVRDAGRGFDPAHTPGFGLSESIVARMSQVGGEARIESSPGMGTTVWLSWPHRSSLRPPAQAGVIAPGRRSRLYLRAMLPSVVAMIYLAIHRASDSVRPVVSLALAGLMGLGMLTTAWYVGRGRPPWPAVLLMASFAPVMTVAVLSISPGRALVAMGTWVITASAVTVGAVSFEARLPQVVLLAVAESGTIASLAYAAPDVMVLDPAGALVLPVGCAAASFAVGALLRRGAKLVAVQDALSNAELDEVGWVESAQVARERYAERLQTNVAPFLRFCAQDRPASTPTLRERATELIGQCRDLLAMSDMTPPTVRQAAQAARKQGIRVAVRDAPSVSPVAWALLAAALQHSTDVDAVTLIPARGGTPARVTVIPRLPGQVESEIKSALEGQTIWVEHTDITTSFIAVSPEWGTSADFDQDLGSTS